MRKALPVTMFGDNDQSRLTTLRNWVLEQKVTEIEMTERQFWKFAEFQPVAEKPWATFMGRCLRVPAMPEGAQKNLGIQDNAAGGGLSASVLMERKFLARVVMRRIRRDALV